MANYTATTERNYRLAGQMGVKLPAVLMFDKLMGGKPANAPEIEFDLPGSDSFAAAARGETQNFGDTLAEMGRMLAITCAEVVADSEAKAEKKAMKGARASAKKSKVSRAATTPDPAVAADLPEPPAVPVCRLSAPTPDDRDPLSDVEWAVVARSLASGAARPEWRRAFDGMILVAKKGPRLHPHSVDDLDPVRRPEGAPPPRIVARTLQPAAEAVVEGKEGEGRKDFDDMETRRRHPGRFRVLHPSDPVKKAPDRGVVAEVRSSSIGGLDAASRPRDKARRCPVDRAHSGLVRDRRRLVDGDDGRAGCVAGVFDEIAGLPEVDKPGLSEVVEPLAVESHGADGAGRLRVAGPRGIEADEYGGAFFGAIGHSVGRHLVEPPCRRVFVVGRPYTRLSRRAVARDFADPSIRVPARSDASSQVFLQPESLLLTPVSISAFMYKS